MVGFALLWGIRDRRSCSIGLGTVHEYLQRAVAAVITWALGEAWDEEYHDLSWGVLSEVSELICRQLAQAPIEKIHFDPIGGQGGCLMVGCLGVAVLIQPPQEIRAGGMEQIVLIEHASTP